MKIYGSKQCPDCRKCKATLETNGIEFTFLDVTEGLLNLKQFSDTVTTNRCLTASRRQERSASRFLYLRTARCSTIGRAGAERTASRL